MSAGENCILNALLEMFRIYVTVQNVSQMSKDFQKGGLIFDSDVLS